jgi:O-antigen ligase
MNPLTRLSHHSAQFENAARIFTLLAGFTLPISTALANISLGLLSVCWLLAGRFHERWAVIRTNPVALAALGLFAIMTLGITYSHAPLPEAWSALVKHRKLLYVPILVTLFPDPLWRRRALYALLAALLLTLLLSYLQAMHLWYGGKAFVHHGYAITNYYVFKSHITQNLLLAFLAYTLFLVALRGQTPGWRLVAAVMGLLAAINVLFLVQGRTGYVVLAALVVWLLYQWRKRQGLLLAVIVLILVAGLALGFSEGFRARVIGIGDTQVIDSPYTNTTLSNQYRWVFYRNSLTLIASHPFVGTGTGSFIPVYQNLVQGREGVEGVATHNPHNEYLFLGVELGLIGLSAFLLWLCLQWRLAWHLHGLEAGLATGLVIAFAVGCLFNSLLLDFTEGNVFVYLSGVLYAGLRAKEAAGETT